jgi:general secretion pathway protein F
VTAFRYHAVTADDRPESGTIEAADPKDAARRLIDRGLFPLDVTLGGRSLAAMLATPIGARALAAPHQAQMLMDLGHLIGAGVEVASALAIMSSSAAGTRGGETIDRLLDQVRIGRSLSEAMADSPARFPAHAVAIIRAGEVSGSLDAALVRVAEGMRRVAQLQAKVRTALIYPSCVAVAVVLALLVLLGVVVPTLEKIVAADAMRLPWQTRFLVGIGNLVRDHAAFLALGAAASAVAAVLALRSPRIRLVLERLALRQPVLGPLLVAAETARIGAMLSMLASARLPWVEAIALTHAGGRLVLTRAAFSSAALKLREGAKLHEALSEVPTLSPRVLALVRIGEMTGRLSPLLEEAAHDAEQQVTTAVDRLLALLTPAMTLLFGAVAGFVLYAVMTSILSVNNLALKTW